MQTTQQKISFRQSRDFGELFNVTIKFFKQNFKPLFKCMLLIAGPFVIVSSIAGAFYQSNMVSFTSMLRNAGVFSNLFTPAYFILIIFSILGSLVLMGVVFEYMLLYSEKGPGEFTVGDVARKLFGDAWKIISTFLGLFLLMVIVIAILALLVGGLTSASPALGILFAIALFLGMFILGPPLIFVFTAAYLVRMKESLGVFASIGKARALMSDNFWWTWLIIVCAYLIVLILSMVFAIPQMFISFMVMFNGVKGNDSSTLNLVFMIITGLSTFCTTFLYSVFIVITNFHYFSLVEQKEGLGLFERIDEIGKAQPDNSNTQY